MKPGFLTLCLLLAGCVPLPPEQMPKPGGRVTQTRFPGLDPGSFEQSSLHFSVRCYSSANARKVSEWAESSYSRIMQDTGLYSFSPSGLYPILVYGTHDEFIKKTAQPGWSTGLAVGNAVFSYEGPDLETTLAHEITHLIFYEYMGPRASAFVWINEGLAVYQELKVPSAAARRNYYHSMKAGFKARSLPFPEMAAFKPASEKDRSVSLWYAQAAGVVEFLIERGGRLGFSIFLKRLRDGKDLESALREGFPGRWSGLAHLESSWKASL